MDFSQDWKSMWTVGNMYEPPLLISSKSLGPLLFSHSPPSHILSSSIPIPFLEQYLKNSHLFINLVHIVRCSSSDFLIFFPTSLDSKDNILNRVGYVKFSLSCEITITKETTIQVDESIKHGFETEITTISVSALQYRNKDEAYLLLATSNASYIHWYRVDIKTLSSTYLSTEQFLGNQFSDVVVECVSWNPYLPHECLVLSKTGLLFVCNLEDSCTSIIPWQEPCATVAATWVGCQFSWHPRVFIVASFTTVSLVDWRPNERRVSILAQMDLFHLNTSIAAGTHCFTAFSMVPTSNGFHFAVASHNFLFLVDIRKPLAPVLQWAHHCRDTPYYINVLKLSDLRSKGIHAHDEYKCASESGFAIMLGSLSTCKFSLFCYGPSFPPPKDGSVASSVSKLCNCLYAWELPSDISMLGRQCNCGDCLLEQDLSNAVIPQWGKQQILGFIILSDAVGMEDSSGFTLIRLVSSGKLEAQRYYASWDSCIACCKSQELSSSVDSSLVDLFIGQDYKFTKKFRYLHLESLCALIRGCLSKFLLSKKKIKPNGKTMMYTESTCKHVSRVLNDTATGVSPSIETFLDDISSPMSIHEITLCRLWGGLDMKLLQLAFTERSKLKDVDVDHRKISLVALDLPDFSHLPSFFLKKPTSHMSYKCKHQQSDDLVGPVLPLPYLLTLEAEGRKNFSSPYLPNADVSHRCTEIKAVACQLVASMANSDPNKRKQLLFHKPCANTVHGTQAYEDKFDTFLYKTREDMTTSSKQKREPVGLDFFDDVCPIELKFAVPEMTFAPQELEGYKVLKKEALKWQKSVKMKTTPQKPLSSFETHHKVL